MEYSKYLKGKVRDQGGVQLNLEQFNALFNLTHLEGSLKAWEEADVIASKTGSPHKYNAQISDTRRMIKNITGEMNPQEFMQSLFENE